MALRLLLRTVAHECYATATAEPLDEAQRELLAVILDGPAARIDGPVHEQLAPVLSHELRPSGVPPVPV